MIIYLYFFKDCNYIMFVYLYINIYNKEKVSISFKIIIWQKIIKNVVYMIKLLYVKKKKINKFS